MNRRAPWVLDPWTEATLVLASLAVTGTVVGLLGWCAGTAASLLTGQGVGPSPAEAWSLTADTGAFVPSALWPGTPVVAVIVVLLLEVLLLGVAGTWAWRRIAARPPSSGFAGAAQFAELVGRGAVLQARRLRPSLRGRVAGLDVGIALGRLGRHGPILRASWEDVVLAICAPRSGKTTCLAVPTVIDAPGAVVATSNKADLWQLTAELRRHDTGQPVWTFDPQGITSDGSPAFAWDALDGVRSVADARRLAGHFLQEIRRSDVSGGDFWDRDAEDLLTALLLAAALDHAPLSQVGAWLVAASAVQPRNTLSRNGFTQLADVMTGRSHGAAETREGVYATARAAAACLSDPQIMAWLTPRAGLPSFDPAAFAGSRESLYLLSKDGAGSAAPLVAALADRVMLEAVRTAERAPSARLDPPLVAVLDEAANICRITELPRLYSHLGSRGVVPITILQSRAQGRRVWGEAGMAELFGAATVKLIGAGIDEAAFAEDISRLVGDHDVPTYSRSAGRTGPGATRSTRRERVLPADAVRALPKFTALLLVTGTRPARLRLQPWMTGPRATDVRTHAR